MSGANLAGGPLSLAVEFVLQLVDFDDPTVRLVGWTMAAFLAGIALLLYLRGRSAGASPPAVLDLADELGKEMLKFIRMRDSTAPAATPSGWSGLPFLPRRDRWSIAGAERESHDAETMSIWTGRFAKKLSSTLAKLHNADRIGHAEAQRLMLPRSPAEVRDVAFRLIELACQEA
jgi:hypothetical protein